MRVGRPLPPPTPTPTHIDTPRTHAHDKVVRVGRLGRLNNPLVGHHRTIPFPFRGGRGAVGDVGRDGGGEKRGLLRYQPQLRPQELDVERRDAVPVEPDLPRSDVVEALEEADDGAGKWWWEGGLWVIGGVVGGGLLVFWCVCVGGGVVRGVGGLWGRYCVVVVFWCGGKG